MKRASRQPDPTPALGVAAYATLTSLLSVMAQNGDGEAVTEVMAGARRYCQQEGLGHSTMVKQALRHIQRWDFPAEPAAPSRVYTRQGESCSARLLTRRAGNTRRPARPFRPVVRKPLHRFF